jgi:hypothetical protein
MYGPEGVPPFWGGRRHRPAACFLGQHSASVDKLGSIARIAGIGGIIMPILGTATMTTMDDKSEFDAFVKRQQQSAASTGADWSRELKDWLRYLSELYGRIEGLLQDYIKSGAIAVSYREIPMNEENIGSYTARQMILKIGPQEITLKPIGTLLIGTLGRVDVVGSSGRTRFLLVNKDASRPNIRITAGVRGQQIAPRPEEPPRPITWTWKIATSPPGIEYIELTQESLFRALMEVANG